MRSGGLDAFLGWLRGGRLITCKYAIQLLASIGEDLACLFDLRLRPNMPHLFQCHAHTLEHRAKVSPLITGVRTFLPPLSPVAPPMPVFRRLFGVGVVLVSRSMASSMVAVTTSSKLSDEPDPWLAVAPTFMIVRPMFVRPMMPSV
jgi:hypothetical protein